MKYQYNDNELLYLIHESEDYAIGILYKKYYNLIYKRLHRFNISKNFEDFFQEGLMALHTAINSFNPFYNKSFNKYFDLILQRRIMTILKKEQGYFYNVLIKEEINCVVNEDVKMYDLSDFIDTLSPFYKKVYRLKFVENYRPREIAELLDINVKKIYNTIYNIRRKYQDRQKMIDKEL